MPGCQRHAMNTTPKSPKRGEASWRSNVRGLRSPGLKGGPTEPAQATGQISRSHDQPAPIASRRQQLRRWAQLSIVARMRHEDHVPVHLRRPTNHKRSVSATNNSQIPYPPSVRIPAASGSAMHSECSPYGGMRRTPPIPQPPLLVYVTHEPSYTCASGAIDLDAQFRYNFFWPRYKVPTSKERSAADFGAGVERIAEQRHSS